MIMILDCGVMPGTLVHVRGRILILELRLVFAQHSSAILPKNGAFTCAAAAANHGAADHGDHGDLEIVSNSPASATRN